MKELRDEFRKWYGLLSVAESVTNPLLVRKIEGVERRFSTLVM